MSWVERSVGDFGKIVTGKTPSTKVPEFFDGEYQFVTPTDLDFGNYYCSGTDRTVSEKSKEKFKNQFIPQDSIMFTCIGNTIGKCGVASSDCLTNQQINSVVPNEEHDPKFLYYLLHHNRETFRGIGIGGGAATPIINKSTFSGVRFMVPEDKGEQKAIGDLLSTYDDLIENNRRRIALLEEAARQLYKEWFVRFRFPGHEHVPIVDGVPEGWEHVVLQDVCARITDGSHSSPKSVDDGYPMASVKDMHDWGINVQTCRQIGTDDYEKLVRGDCKPLVNDVLIAKDGSYLKHSFVVQEDIDLVLLSSIAILRPNERIDPHLLNFFLRDPHTKERMKGYVSGVALPRIILKEFRNFKLLLPPSNLQDQWAEFAGDMATQCNKLLKQNDKLARARDLLLPKLMSGEITV